MVIIGVIGFKGIIAETHPAVDFATAIISTSYPGASAIDVEAKITKPVEDEIKTVSDIKNIYSVSQPGASTIVILVDMDKRGISIPKTMSDIQNAMNRVANLPSDLQDRPRFLEIKSEEFSVVTIAITGPNINRQRDLVADFLKEDIEDNKSVKSISLDGYTKRSFNIDLDPKKLSSYNIGINEVLEKIGARNVDIPSGDLKSAQKQILTKIEAKVQNIEELKELVVRSNFNGKIIKLKDIASIIDSEEEPRMLARYNGEEATLLTINKKSNSDMIRLAKNIDEKLAVLKKQYDGKFSFYVVQDESKIVKEKLSILIEHALLGVAMVMGILFLFLPWRSGIATALSLPLTVLATIGFMFFANINLNNVTILALIIVLGTLVDNGIVISEVFIRNRSHGMDLDKAAISSVDSLKLPIIATAFATIASFLPMLVTNGIMGKFIKWIPIVVTLALLINLLECLFLMPMRLVLFSKNDKSEHKEHWFDKFEVMFKAFIFWALKKRYLVLLGFFGVIITSFVMIFAVNKFILFPNEQTEIYVARFELSEGSRLENTSKVMADISAKIKEKMGKKVEHIVFRAGITDLNASQPKYEEGSNVGYAWIYVDLDTKYNVNYQDFITELNSIKFDGVEKITFDGQFNGPPVGNDIEATFRSNSFEDIDSLTKLIKGDLETVKGIRDLKLNDVFGEDEIVIHINYEKADQLGLKTNMIGNIIKTAIAGNAVSQVVLDNKNVNLLVRLNDESRHSLADLKNIQVMDQRGNLIELEKFATFEERKGASFIRRFDSKRAKTLLGSVDSAIITSSEANKHLKESFVKHAPQFPSVSLKFGGVEESTNDSMSSLGSAFILSILAIFSLLVFSFKSYIKPIIILTTIPLGLFGFSIGFFLHHKPISFFAIIGIIGLGGIIVNSGIILISYILELEKTKKDTMSLHEILAFASSMRLRPVIITKLTTIAGLLPTAYGIGGSDAILLPMTLAMMWGLLLGTILTLVWVPCLYAILDDLSGWIKNNKTYANSFLQKISRRLIFWRGNV